LDLLERLPPPVPKRPLNVLLIFPRTPLSGLAIVEASATAGEPAGEPAFVGGGGGAPAFVGGGGGGVPAFAGGGADISTLPQ